MLKPGLTIIIMQGEDPGNGLPFLSQLLADQASIGYSFHDTDKKVIVLSHHQYRNLQASEIEIFLEIYPKICILLVSTDRLMKGCERCIEIARVVVELNSKDSSGVRVIKQGEPV